MILFVLLFVVVETFNDWPEAITGSFAPLEFRFTLQSLARVLTEVGGSMRKQKAKHKEELGGGLRCTFRRLRHVRIQLRVEVRHAACINNVICLSRNNIKVRKHTLLVCLKLIVQQILCDWLLCMCSAASSSSATTTTAVDVEHEQDR